MKRLIAPIAMIASLSAACSPIVLQPIDGESTRGSNTSGSGGASSGSSGGPSVGPNAIAMRGRDVSADLLATIVPNVEISIDPNALVVFVSNVPEQCAAPTVSITCDPTATWQYIVAVPLALDKPGTIDLSSQDIPILEAYALSDNGCGIGRGATYGWGGMMEILTSDATSVSFTLQGTSPTDGLSFDGNYTANRCGAPPPAPAVAFRASDLPAQSMGTGAATASGGGATTDPNTLVVFVGNATCTNPWDAIDETGTSRMTFTIPPSLQHAGQIDLADPQIAASYEYSLGDSTGGGGMVSGTLQIDSVDANGVSFTLIATSHDAPPDSVQASFDGAYVSAICL